MEIGINKGSNGAVSNIDIDVCILERIAARYSNVANIYVYAVDAAGEMICEKTGDSADYRRLNELIGEDVVNAVYERVTSDDLEVQAIEDTCIPNIKVAGVSLHVNGNALITWIIAGIFSDGELIKLPGAVLPLEFSRVTTLKSFSDSMDIIRDVTELIIESKLSVESAEAESRRSKFSEEETKASLKRAEAVSEIVQLLESSDAIEVIMNMLLKQVGTYLDISGAYIARVKGRTEYCDIAAEWYNTGVIPYFERQMGQKRARFMYLDKPVVISGDTDTDEVDKAFMDDINAAALCSIPIMINGKPSMYACFADSDINRRWSTYDIKFIYDSIKILQSIITKRIQKNSLASSYASLEAILDNVGSAIYVRDIETGTALFSNRILKNYFTTELATGKLDDLFDSALPVSRDSGIYEVFHAEKNKWYDLHYTYINWVDGRKVSLCAAYDVTDKKNYQKRIEQQSYTDFLTGLYNRLCCERDLAMHIDSAKSSGTKGALLYLDLDDFKHINDGLGHQYGDILLKAISHSLTRIEGIKNTCYRMGGDEFVIIIPPQSYNTFRDIVSQIEDIFSKPWYLKDADYYCTMSMGVVEFPDMGENVQDLIKKADFAMYEAKKDGKNRVTEFSNDYTTASNERLGMEKNMREAMLEGYKEFEVYYQPIIDITAGNKCIGAEALIRWNSSELGFVGPQEFIPLAEYLGLINPIGNHVLKTACLECDKWNKSGHPDYKVNVNLSVVQLLQPDIVETVGATIKETGINPKNLTLEVTESLAINDMERMVKILEGIKALGVKIALDDFGTGYSSLKHIREIPFDVIKVDQCFVKDLSEDAYSQAFVKMVAELAETIGVSVCVEGIETDKQLKALSGMKVKMIQGYYFDRPMQHEVFEEKYVN